MLCMIRNKKAPTKPKANKALTEAEKFARLQRRRCDYLRYMATIFWIGYDVLLSLPFIFFITTKRNKVWMIFWFAQVFWI